MPSYWYKLCPQKMLCPQEMLNSLYSLFACFSSQQWFSNPFEVFPCDLESLFPLIEKITSMARNCWCTLLILQAKPDRLFRASLDELLNLLICPWVNQANCQSQCNLSLSLSVCLYCCWCRCGDTWTLHPWASCNFVVQQPTHDIDIAKNCMTKDVRCIPIDETAESVQPVVMNFFFWNCCYELIDEYCFRVSIHPNRYRIYKTNKRQHHSLWSIEWNGCSHHPLFDDAIQKKNVHAKQKQLYGLNDLNKIRRCRTPPDLLMVTHQLQHYRAVWCCKDRPKPCYTRFLLPLSTQGLSDHHHHHHHGHLDHPHHQWPWAAQNQQKNISASANQQENQLLLDIFYNNQSRNCIQLPQSTVSTLGTHVVYPFPTKTRQHRVHPLQ